MAYFSEGLQAVNQASKTRHLSPASSNLQILPDSAAKLTDRNFSSVATTVVNTPKPVLTAESQLTHQKNGDDDDNLTLENTTENNNSPAK